MTIESNYKLTLLIFVIFSSTLIFAQKTHTVTLTCDTSSITKDNVNEVCNFGQSSGISNKDYTIDVNKGDIVVWRGEAINSRLSSSLKLIQVNHHEGRKVFGRNTLRDQEGLITAEVIEGQPGDEEKYNLKFKVYVDGRRLSDTFEIDPKIRIMR